MTQAQTLADVQGYADTRGIAIQRVGVKDVLIPINMMQKDGKTQTVQASATLSVGLLPERKGAHLSRFVIQLAQWCENRAFTHNLREFLQEMQRLQETPSSHVRLDFKYFVPKKAPVTDNWAPMAYDCSFEASLNDDKYAFSLGLDMPIATLCPCSKAISDYGAHNQRCMLKTTLQMDTNVDSPMVWIEELVKVLDECASCPTYPILKRVDEKYVTERAYDNPKFVEDVIREVTQALEMTPGVVGFSIEVEALESIHAHNAWAYENRLIPLFHG